MCGIFGFAGSGSEDWRAALLLQELAKKDEVRGRHSTGLVIQSAKGSCYVKKDVGDGASYVAGGNSTFLFKHKIVAALGHNRFATTGEISKRNAHPFCQKINGKWAFGVHNGIVGNYEELCEEFGVAKPAVDSEAVFRAIARMRREGATIPDAIEEVTYYISSNADFAFAYLDQDSRDVYLWRSPDRPLTIFDAGKLNLGKWFCSTEEIFIDAWMSIKGPLGMLKKVSHFEAVPYRLYRIKAGKRSDLVSKKIRDLRHQERWSYSASHDENYTYGFDEDDLLKSMDEDKGDRSACTDKQLSLGSVSSRLWEHDKHFLKGKG